MILTKSVKVHLINSNISHYKQYYTDIKSGDYIDVSIDNLSKKSHYTIEVCCDVCGKNKKIPYRQYFESYNNHNMYCCCPKCAQIKNKKTSLEKYGVENYNSLDECKEKIKQTNNKKYDVDYYFQSDDKKVKSLETCMSKYGVEYPTQNEYIRNKIKESFINKYGVEYISQSKYWKEKTGCVEKTGFEEYKRKVSNETRKNVKELQEKWNGYDYYDNEYIKNNFILNKIDKIYPTIDHKISVYYGYINNISVEEISNIENLCYTKRSINSSKNKKCEYERKEKN